MARVFIIVTAVSTLVCSLHPTLYIPCWVFFSVHLIIGVAYIVFVNSWAFVKPLDLEKMGVRNPGVVAGLMRVRNRRFDTLTMHLLGVTVLNWLCVLMRVFGCIDLLKMVVVQPFFVTLSLRADVFFVAYASYTICWSVYKSIKGSRLKKSLISKIEDERD